MPIVEPGLEVAQRLQQRLRAQVPDVRWARPETLHLTVHFFGQVEEGRAAAAVELVAPIARHTLPFTVVLDRLGSFPPHGVPRVLWLGPSSDVDFLNALALDCRTVLGTAGFDIDQRTYNPHCTLGRPRMRWSAASRSAWSAARQEQPDVRFTASRLVLYESRSAAGGAVYTERASLNFAAA